MASKPTPITSRQFIYAIHRSHQNGLFIRTEYIQEFGLQKAVFLEQLIALDMYFNQDPDKADDTGGWFFRTRDELEARTGIGERQQTRFTQQLKKDRIIEVVLHGLPARNWYRINYEKLQELFTKIPDEGSAVKLRGLPQSNLRDYIGKPYRLHKSQGNSLGSAASAAEPESSQTLPPKKPSSRTKFPPTRQPKPRDPRVDHPAIQAVHQVAGLYPPKTKGDADVWAQVIGAVGEEPSHDLLKQCYEAWLAKGYNPHNWAWVLDWYPKGGPPGHHPQRKEPPAALKHGPALERLAKHCPIHPDDLAAVDEQYGRLLQAKKQHHPDVGPLLDRLLEWLDNAGPNNGGWLAGQDLKPGHLDPGGRTMVGFFRWVHWYVGDDG